MLTPNDRGYNSIRINVKGRATGQSGSDMIKLIQSEINRQVPVNFQFNYQASDTRDHLNSEWLSSKMAEALGTGRAW